MVRVWAWVAGVMVMNLLTVMVEMDLEDLQLENLDGVRAAEVTSAMSRV